MSSSLVSSSFYWRLMTIYKDGLAGKGGGPKFQAEEDFALPRAAQVFTAAVTIGGLVSTAVDPGEAESLTVAQIALLVPIVYKLGQVGPHQYLPQDVRENLIGLLADFEAKAPTLVSQLREQLISGANEGLERAS